MASVRLALRVCGEVAFPRKPIALLPCGPSLPSNPTPFLCQSSTSLLPSTSFQLFPFPRHSFHSSIPSNKTTKSPPPPSFKNIRRKSCVGSMSRVYRCYSFFLFPYYFSKEISKYTPPPEESDNGKGRRVRREGSRQITGQVDDIVAEYYLAHNVNPSKRLAWISGSANTEERVMDIQEQGHVVIAATVLAYYRLLRRDFTERDALKILQKALLGCGPNWAYSVIDLPLVLSSNKRRILMESDQLMGKIHDFIDLITDCLAGRSYDLSIWSDSVNDSIVTVTVNRCFFHSFFEEQGEPQLTELFCHWEQEVVLSNIEPHKHYLRSQRTKCLARGDKNCHFCLHHKERSDTFDPLKNLLPET